MNGKEPSLIKLENQKSVITIDLFGGAITNFRLKNIDINPLSFAFSKEQMPVNNKEGAPYQGHFLCLGRWGEPSEGEINAGLPDHGQFANILWHIEDNKHNHVLKMKVAAPLEGLSIERKIILDEEHPVVAVKELVQNINPLGRLFNMVQHPTLAAPFLDKTTIIDCNGWVGFDQAHYKDVSSKILQWPVAKDSREHKVDMRKSLSAYNAVFSFVIKPGCEYGWVTAFSPADNLLFGYIWKRSDYPWIHHWQHYKDGNIQYRGIEFGTAGIHQPFNEIINTNPVLFGEKTFAFIDAGQYIYKNYFSFLYHTGSGFSGVKDINIINDQIQIKGKKGSDINLILGLKLINELSK
ncbi:MAG: hypothetical protein ABI760_24950 [Ferruginibacter sp.]